MSHRAGLIDLAESEYAQAELREEWNIALSNFTTGLSRIESIIKDERSYCERNLRRRHRCQGRLFIPRRWGSGLIKCNQLCLLTASALATVTANARMLLGLNAKATNQHVGYILGKRRRSEREQAASHQYKSRTMRLVQSKAKPGAENGWHSIAGLQSHDQKPVCATKSDRPEDLTIAELLDAYGLQVQGCSQEEIQAQVNSWMGRFAEIMAERAQTSYREAFAFLDKFPDGVRRTHVARCSEEYRELIRLVVMSSHTSRNRLRELQRQTERQPRSALYDSLLDIIARVRSDVTSILKCWKNKAFRSLIPKIYGTDDLAAKVEIDFSWCFTDAERKEIPPKEMKARAQVQFRGRELLSYKTEERRDKVKLISQHAISIYYRLSDIFTELRKICAA